MRRALRSLLSMVRRPLFRNHLDRMSESAWKAYLQALRAGRSLPSPSRPSSSSSFVTISPQDWERIQAVERFDEEWRRVWALASDGRTSPSPEVQATGSRSAPHGAGR